MEAQLAQVHETDVLHFRSFLVMIVSRHARKRLGWVPTWSFWLRIPKTLLSISLKVVTLEMSLAFLVCGRSLHWPATAEALELQLYRGDQGPFGHVKRKPITWASDRPLPELCVKGPSCVVPVGAEVGTCRSHDQAFESQSWAKWAPGVIEVLKACLREVLVSGRVCKPELNWAQHVAHGHWLPSRLCRDCVLGSAAQRPHKRVVAPQAYTLGLDLPGPYKRSQDELSQRRRYMLTAVYTVPVDVNGRPLLAESQPPR